MDGKVESFSWMSIYLKRSMTLMAITQVIGSLKWWLKRYQRVLEDRTWFVVGGGEEFIALIINADEKITLSIAERIRCLVEKSSVVYESSRIFVTVSVGVTLTCSGDTLETVVQRADNLMYMSKESGRNRTTTDFGNWGSRWNRLVER